MEGRVDGDRPQGMGWWQLPLCQGQQPRAGTKELKPKNLHLIFEGVSVGLGLWSMPPQQLGPLSPLGWVCWGVTGSDAAAGLSLHTQAVSLKLLQLYKSQLYLEAEA